MNDKRINNIHVFCPDCGEYNTDTPHAGTVMRTMFGVGECEKCGRQVLSMDRFHAENRSFLSGLSDQFDIWMHDRRVGKRIDWQNIQ